MPLTDLERRVVERLHASRGAIERDLAEWVEIPTGWNHAPGLDLLRSILRRRLESIGGHAQLLPGAEAQEWAEEGPVPPTLVVRGGHEAPKRSAAAGGAQASGHEPCRAGPLLFSGHLDTVFDPRGEFRSFRRHGERAIGPGVSDMKGGLAILVAVLESLQALEALPPWTVVLNSDEERGSCHSASHLRRLAGEHSVGFVLEPALPDGGLVVARLGSGRLELRATGRSAHAGRDFTSGVSAIDALAHAIIAASRVSDPAGGRIVNLGVIHGGEAPNIVPERAAAVGTVRFRDREAAAEIERRLRAVARGGEQELPRVEVRLSLNRPAKPLTAALRPFIELCLRAAEDLGCPLVTGSTGGTSDGNILEDAGLPTLDSLGVRGGNLHRTDEFVELSSITDRAALLAVTILRVAARVGLSRG